MNVFEKAIEDIFNVGEFVEYFQDVETEQNIKTIVYQKNTDGVYTQFGFDSGVNFYLTCKTSDYTPKKGKKIIYKDVTYRIDSFLTDSFGLSHNIFLKSLTSK